MELMEEQKLTVLINGEETECDVLFTYVDDESGKVFIGYTDHSKTKDGRTNIFYSSYDPVLGPEKLEKVTDPREVELIKDILQEIDRSVKNGTV